MRISARLKASGTSSKLKDEKFLNSISSTEDFEDEEILKENFEEEEEESDFDDEKLVAGSSLKKSTKSTKITPKPKPKPTTNDQIKDKCNKPARKKLKRTGGYIPPIENELKRNKLLLSCEEWTKLIDEQKLIIKRRNRWMKTLMCKNVLKKSFAKINFSSFKNILTVQPKTALKVFYKSNSESFLLNDHLNLDENTLVFNSGHSIFASCFCECKECVINESHQTIFTVSHHKIVIISAEICSKRGILLVKETGFVLSPNSEIFKSISLCGNALSISTNQGIYFIDCHVLHTDNLAIILEKSSSCGITDISCHSCRGNLIAIGTISGKLHIFNSEFKEIFQTVIKYDSAIYSVDWKDDHTILLGGIFPKIFSIDLRDPHLIETEVSVLASLPIVKWSESLKSILFSDAENHGRRLEKGEGNDATNHLHQPFGTFDSMILDMSTSLNHNILASACASGSIHLAWMSEEPNHGVELEKKIFSIKNSDDDVGSVSLISTSEYVTFQLHDNIKLYPSSQACTSVAWSANPKFPGLLAAGYRNGMLILMATDRFFI